MYYELALRDAPSVGRKRAWPYRVASYEELIALAAEMLRYDPRLLSILLQYLMTSWSSLNPVSLRALMKRMRWPQALLVVLDFAKSATNDPELRYFAETRAPGSGSSASWSRPARSSRWPIISPPWTTRSAVSKPCSICAASRA
jgi:hypothetical protein